MSSVNVTGISDAELAAMPQADVLGNQTPSVDQMRYETQVANSPTPSFMESLPSLDEASNYLANLPSQAQRFLTNPAAFTEMLTGKNPLPEQTGFAASATGMPAQNPNSLFTPAGMAYNTGYESGVPVSIAAMGVPALAPAGRFLGQAAGERIMAGKPLIPGTNTEYLNPQIMSAVKNKGGNWIDSSLGVDKLKKPIREESYVNQIRNDVLDGVQRPESLETALRDNARNGAINNWIDSKLKKYIKNEMGTPTDPVRELHDQGITHIPNAENLNPNYAPTIEDVKIQRAAAGMPVQGFANTPLGKNWENLTDQAIRNKSAGTRVESSKITQSPRILEENPWLKTIDPTSPVHNAGAFINDLEFRHLTDELSNSIRHNSDLPQHLRLKPEALDRVTVPQAVKHVAKINKWRAEQIAKAAKEDLKDFPIVHEGGNGFNIHELKLPEHNKPYEELSEKRKELHDDMVKDELKFSPGYALKEANKREAYDKLDRALKNEGKQMGHCVGGYTDSVARGDSRIFSLRDEKGGAHATVEAIPKILDYNPKHIPQEVQNEIDKHAHAETIKAGYPENSQGYWNHYTGVQIQDGTRYLKDHPVMDIKQIKGKGNGEVSDKYHTYIKNWLNKESDKINYVNDLHNVGLHDLKNGLVRQENLDKRLAEGFKSGELKRFSTDEEVRDFMNKPAAPEKPLAKTPEQMRNELFEKSRADEATRKANEPRNLQQRMRDQGLLPPEGYKDGGAVKYENPEDKEGVLSYNPELYQRVADSVNKEGQSGGYNDAARHIIASADMTRRFGSIPAAVLGYGHELANYVENIGGKKPQTVEDMQQDLHNNAVGRQLGSNASSFQDIVNRTPETLDVRPYQMEDTKAMVRNPNEVKTPYKPFGLFKNGGSVNIDEMRLALLRNK